MKNETADKNVILLWEARIMKHKMCRVAQCCQSTDDKTLTVTRLGLRWGGDDVTDRVMMARLWWG